MFLFQIQKLCGRKGKRGENVQIIDVSGEEIMPDPKEWLTKQLTQERPNRSHRKGFGPSSQQRRKHQITYLAFQVKCHSGHIEASKGYVIAGQADQQQVGDSNAVWIVVTALAGFVRFRKAHTYFSERFLRGVFFKGA